MSRITYNRVVSQGGSEESVPAGTLSNQRGHAYTSEIHESAHAQITNPHRVVVIPRYFIQHWLPLLGPSRSWLILAFRQAAFVSRKHTKEAIQPLAVRQLTRWSGLSHGQVWNLISDPSYMDWFVRKVEKSEAPRESDVWGVQVSVPVAPHHLQALEDYIRQTYFQDDNHDIPTYLRALMRDIPSILSDHHPQSVDFTHEPRTVHQIVAALTGPLDDGTSRICDEIAGRIVQPGNTIAISHYFMDRWRNELTSGEAWLLFVLRTFVYISNSRAFTFVEGGKTKLAALLGVNTRSVRRWFANLPKSALVHFIQVESSSDSSSGLELEISLQDPVHANDFEEYKQLVIELGKEVDKTGQGEGQNWTETPTKFDRWVDKSGHGGGQNWTKGRTIVDGQPDNNGHRTGHNWTDQRTKLDTSIGFNQEIQSKSLIHDTQLQPAHEIVFKKVVVGEWDIDRILQTSGTTPEKRAGLLVEMQKNPDLSHRFVAWLIYGYENRAQNGRGINSPVLFALSRVAHSHPSPLYLELADESPQSIQALILKRQAPNISSDWRRVLEALEKNGFPDLLDLLMPDHPTGLNDSREPELSSETVDGRIGKNPIEGHSIPEEMLTNDTPQDTYPESAESFWEQIIALVGENINVNIVSMWLNDLELEVSFTDGKDLELVRGRIKKYIQPLSEVYPGCSFRLRHLRIAYGSAGDLPAVEVVEEVKIG